MSLIILDSLEQGIVSEQPRPQLFKLRDAGVSEGETNAHRSSS